MLSFSYEITHIDGTENVWADLLSRWIDPILIQRGIRSVKRRHTYHMDDYDHVHTLQSDSFEIPQLDDIIRVQQQFIHDLPDDAIQNDVGLYVVNNLIWIPPRDIELTTRLMIIGHCGPQGHRG